MQGTTPYDSLLLPKRLRPSTQRDRSMPQEVLSDKARVVTASGFRRLQTKAQVFSLEENATVRTRLTHTLEVATYGQWIAHDVSMKLVEQGKLSKEQILPFMTTVENACLLHDVGNPPFGHLGEFAIQDWFSQKETAKKLKATWKEHGVPADEIDLHYWAFQHFDGNPQGFRVVTRLQWLKDEYGLNLTCALLASMLKYLVPQPRSGRPFAKKAGYFATELDLVRKVWEALGLDVQDGLPAQRYPLAFLMEAADDIAYCVSDLEDALEKRIIRQEDLFDSVPASLHRFLPAEEPKPHTSYQAARDAKFLLFKTSMVRYLANAAERVYVDNHDAILDGSFGDSLLDTDDVASQAVDFLKTFTRKNVFMSREAIHVEVSGFRVIHTLLDHFKCLLTLSPDEFDVLRPYTDSEPELGAREIERRLVTLLPHKHFMCYRYAAEQRPELEPVYRTHLIVDYIAGMTDSHSVKVFEVLTGTGAGMNL